MVMASSLRIQTTPKWMVIWTEKFEEIPPTEKPSTRNCSGFQLTIILTKMDLAISIGIREPIGFPVIFYIDGYLGPYQGLMSAVISAAKTV
ncbi:Uncharacterised protein [Leclercia adecarboxylata]|uniref:Uncharacterized protein n=1 Tax=Leclercia adecarboxylata TaxID=83655 RepID=A0A4U9HYA6_9ENTR|nr:Uncharacterised protein [Leclercia adecarboxylata]